jgi:hypothetical protein
MYALHTSQPFHIPTNLGAADNGTRPVMAGQPPDLTPLIRTKQVSIGTKFNRRKHYFLSIQNIE